MRAGHVAPLAAAVMFCVLPALAQTNYTYQKYSPAKGGDPYIAAPNEHSADFNSDGFADVLSPTIYYVCSGGTCNAHYALYLYLNTGSGLGSPNALPVTLNDLPAGIAISDFNGDKKLDIAVLSPSGELSILYGKGDGTFQTAVNRQLPAGNYSALVEADFDINNTQDLAALRQNGSLVLLFNDGKGNFTQQSATIDTPPSGYTDTSLVVGDFNADGRPDIAWVQEGDENSQDNTVYSALNTAKGAFSAKHELGTTMPGFGHLLAPDLDLDGRSDVITWSTQLSENCCQPFPVTLYYSNGNGTFTSKVLDQTTTDDIGVTDINGDGYPDVLLSSEEGFTIYTGNGNRTFENQGTNSMLQGGTDQVALGFYDANNTMDFASQNGGVTDENYDTYIYELFNQNAQLTCPYPTSPGVTFCQAVGSGNSVLVRGTARAQTQPVRHIELWANGKKLYQVFSDEFNATLNVPASTPITAVEVEANGATRSTTVTPSPEQTCDAPSSPGVNVCKPTQGENVASPVEFLASGTGASGTVNHLELWIDGTKIGNYSGSTMDTTVAEPTGSHTATVIEVDSKGNYVKSTPVTYTVGGGSGSCAAPSSPGVDVCSPKNGSTDASPVDFIASGTGASGSVNHLELWIDGKKIGNYDGSTMNASVTVAAGSHTAQVVEVDSKGNYVKSSPVTFTVSSGTRYVAYVFNATQPLNGGEQAPPTVQEIGVQPNGDETYGQVLQIPQYASGGIVANPSYVFIPDGQSAIYALDISAYGELSQGATTNTSAEGGQGPVFLDRAGQTLYSWTETSTYPEIISWSIGANGALTMLNSVSLNTPEPAQPQVAFLPNNQIAYWTGCGPSDASPGAYGFRRASNGALTEFNPNINYPAPPADQTYCPEGAAAADNTHVVVALMAVNYNNYAFYDTQLAVYTVGADGSLTTTNTNQSMPTLSSEPNAYAFDPTDTWLALGDSSGLDLYRYSNGVLTHTDSLTLSGGVAQVNWDASGHLFLVGQPCCGGTAVYTVTSSGSLTPASDNGTWSSGLSPGILQTVLSLE